MSSYSIESYNNFLQELKTIEKMLKSDLKELKINSGNNVNTVNTENSIRKNLDSYMNNLNKTRADYTSNANEIKKTIPEKEYNRRVNEIVDLNSNVLGIKSEYEGVISNKYKYVKLILLLEARFCTQ
jgi:hypothetical protein